MAKRQDSKYESSQRSGAWQKMRVNQGQELVIAGYTPSDKNFDALVIGFYEDGKLMYAARTRNGFTPASRAELFKKLKPLEIAECPFANLPDKKVGRWGAGLAPPKWSVASGCYAAFSIAATMSTCRDYAASRVAGLVITGFSVLLFRHDQTADASTESCPVCFTSSRSTPRD